MDATRFLKTYCSQCGAEFGPGDSGFSHCGDHALRSEVVPCKDCFGKGYNDEFHAVAGHYNRGETFRMECEACEGAGHTTQGAAP